MQDKNGCKIDDGFKSVPPPVTHTLSYHYIKLPDGSYKRKWKATIPKFTIT